MGFTEGDISFIKRTKELIEWYDTLVFQDKKAKRDVTLLINCMIGLVFIFHEKWNTEILSISIDSCRVWKPKYIKYIQGKANMQNIIEHIRNSVAHFHLYPITMGGSKEITHIVFKDYNIDGLKECNFELRMPILQFKKFILGFVNSMLQTHKL
jgi:hypothetical protein